MTLLGGNNGHSHPDWARSIEQRVDRGCLLVCRPNTCITQPYCCRLHSSQSLAAFLTTCRRDKCYRDTLFWVQDGSRERDFAWATSCCMHTCQRCRVLRSRYAPQLEVHVSSWTLPHLEQADMEAHWREIAQKARLAWHACT